MRTLTVFKVKGQGKRVRILYKPEFSSGFFVTAKVAYITAMIILHLIILYFKCVTVFQVIHCRAMR